MTISLALVPAFLAFLPVFEADITVAVLLAHVHCLLSLLVGPSEERSAGEATHGSVVHVVVVRDL